MLNPGPCSYWANAPVTGLHLQPAYFHRKLYCYLVSPKLSYKTKALPRQAEQGNSGEEGSAWRNRLSCAHQMDGFGNPTNSLSLLLLLLLHSTADVLMSVFCEHKGAGVQVQTLGRERQGQTGGKCLVGVDVILSLKQPSKFINYRRNNQRLAPVKQKHPRSFRCDWSPRRFQSASENQ